MNRPGQYFNSFIFNPPPSTTNRVIVTEFQVITSNPGWANASSMMPVGIVSSSGWANLTRLTPDHAEAVIAKIAGALDQAEVIPFSDPLP